MAFLKKSQQCFMSNFLHSNFPKSRWIWGMSRAARSFEIFLEIDLIYQILNLSSVYLLSGSFYWTLAVAMVCSGINYAAMLSDMVSVEDNYRRNEIVEMVTGGDTRDEFVPNDFFSI